MVKYKFQPGDIVGDEGIILKVVRNVDEITFKGKVVKIIKGYRDYSIGQMGTWTPMFYDLLEPVSKEHELW